MFFNEIIFFPVLDASGRFPSGFMQGNWHDFGDYYQCLGINKVIQDVDIQGKYCAIQVPLQQDPFEIPEFPSIPGGDVWPEDWLPIFPTAAPPTIPPTEAPGDPPADPPTKEQAKIYENYMRLQAYARGISGVGEPVESRYEHLSTQ